MELPLNGWLVFVRENAKLKWMMTGGNPMTQETSMYTTYSLSVNILELFSTSMFLAISRNLH